MKITIYTVSDCQFSKAEKEYLQSHNLPYEEKNLEQNQEWLKEMFTISNNFAGTPVTKIEKDDGQIVVLKGFTKEEFDQVLSFKKEENVAQEQVDAIPLSQSTPNQQTTQPITKPASNIQPQATFQTPQTSTPPQTEQTITTKTEPNIIPPNQSTDPLSTVISNLEQKTYPNEQNQPSSQPINNIPNIPDFNQ